MWRMVVAEVVFLWRRWRAQYVQSRVSMARDAHLRRLGQQPWGYSDPNVHARVIAFNAAVPTGTAVRYWLTTDTGFEPMVARTTSPAFVRYFQHASPSGGVCLDDGGQGQIELIEVAP